MGKGWADALAFEPSSSRPPADETPRSLLAGPDPAQTALNLYAKVLSSTTLKGAAHALVAALETDLRFTRASIGLRENGRTRLLASSGLDAVPDQTTLARALVGAMDEAIDQGASVCWPSVDGASILIEQQALHRLVGGSVASVPLGRDGDVFGALCVERGDAGPITAHELDRLEQVMALAVPALCWMQHGMRPWHRRAWLASADNASKWQRPKHRVTRRVLLVLALAALFMAAVPLDHEVGGRARVEGAEQRVLVAPADGFVKTAHVRPGDRVKAGDALVDLVDGDLRLERERWTSQLAQHENAYAAAMAKPDRAAAATSLARISDAQSQLALVDEQLARGRVLAPFDGLVIQGDLSQTIGAPVRQGDTLLTLATTGRHRVIVEIDEVDIAGVRPGQAGQLSLSSLPWDRQDLVVERITPLAKAVDGRNVFEVETRLLAPRADLRPGLLGRAELVIGRQPPLWSWTRHTVDRLRVAWWAWLG